MENPVITDESAPQVVAAQVVEMQLAEPSFPVVNEEEAIAEINRIYQKNAINTYLEIGQYVLKTFFNDDPLLYYSQNPFKTESLKRVLKHDRLQVKRTFLLNAVRLAIYEKNLGDDPAWQRLNPSVKIELLLLRSDELIRSMAQRITGREEEPTVPVRQVRELVRKERAKLLGGAKRGPRPLPPFIKQLGAVKRAMKRAGLVRLTPETAANLNEAQRKRAKEMLNGILQEVQQALEVLKET